MRGRDVRVLVVEDEVRLAEALQLGLRAEGFAVEVAHDGELGLHLATEREYDVVVLDVMLPRLNGYRVCQRLRRAGNWVPVLVRRGAPARPTVLLAGDLSLDPARREVRRDGHGIDLTPREFSLLEYLMRHRDEVVPKQDILEHVWDAHYDGDPNVVEVYVGYLRRKIDAPFGRRCIQTVRGAGYRLVGTGG